MPITDNLYRVLQDQATLDHTRSVTADTQALAQQRLLGVMMNQRTMQQNIDADEALKSGRFANPASTPGGAGPAAPDPLAQYDYQSPLLDAARVAQQGVQQNRERLAIAKYAGSSVLMNKASSDMDNQAKEYTSAMKAVLADDEKRTTMAAQAMQNVKTAAEAKDALAYVQDTLGPKKAQMIGQQFAKALPGGLDNATDEQVQAALKPITSFITNRGNQLRFLSSAESARQQEESRKERARVADNKAAAAQTAGAATLDPADTKAVGAQIAAGVPLTQAVPGYGKWVQPQRDAARKEALQQIKDEEGVDDADAGRILAQRGIDYVAGRRSTTQLNTMRGATSVAVKQLDFNVDKATEEMKKLPSTDLSPVLNALVRGAERWTGAPEYASLYFYMHAAAMESAKILSGGQASIAQLNVAAAEEAKKWADISITPAMWGQVSKAMHDEGTARLDQYDAALKEQRVGKPRGDATPTKAAPAAALPAGSVVVPGRGGKQYQWVGPAGKQDDPAEKVKRENWKAI